MKISLVSVGVRRGRGKRVLEDALTKDYLSRADRYVRVEGSWMEGVAEFWAAVEQAPGRTPARVILMDSAGQLRTSMEFAEVIRDFRDRGSQRVIVGIGGADGWDLESRKKADLVLSIGPWTLPHGLARVVVAEQIYRALTILAGHPYHCGH